MIDSNDFGIGVDIVDIDRFEKYTKKDSPFVLRLFTKEEIEYCFKSVKSAQRLAARYCAKEACLKALSSMGYDSVSYCDFEVKKNKNGAPVVNILNEKYKDKFDIKISLSHSNTSAVCYAMAVKKHSEIDFFKN